MQKPLVISIFLLGAVLIYFNVSHYNFLKSELIEDLQELADISVNEIMESVVNELVVFKSSPSATGANNEIFYSHDSSIVEIEMVKPFLDSAMPEGLDSSFFKMMENMEADSSAQISVIINTTAFEDSGKHSSETAGLVSSNYLKPKEIRSQFDSIYSGKLLNKQNGISFFYASENSFPVVSYTEVKFETIGMKNEQIGFRGQRIHVLKSLLPTIIISLLLFGVLLFAYRQNSKVLKEQKALAVAKDDFMANITHELKTPISAVKVAMEAMIDFEVSKQPEKVTQYATESQKQLNKLDGLINRILENSNSNSKDLTLKKEIIDVELLAQESVHSFMPASDLKNLTVELSEIDSAKLSADKLHLSGLMNNLIDNAVKYSPANETIVVKVKDSPKHVLFSVKNFGITLTSEEQALVFDKLYRVPKHNIHDVKGHGLGLYYVKSVAEAHYGSAKVASKENWVEFTVSIPKT